MFLMILMTKVLLEWVIMLLKLLIPIWVVRVVTSGNWAVKTIFYKENDERRSNLPWTHAIKLPSEVGWFGVRHHFFEIGKVCIRYPWFCDVAISFPLQKVSGWIVPNSHKIESSVNYVQKNQGEDFVEAVAAQGDDNYKILGPPIGKRSQGVSSQPKKHVGFSLGEFSKIDIVKKQCHQWSHLFMLRSFAVSMSYKVLCSNSFRDCRATVRNLERDDFKPMAVWTLGTPGLSSQHSWHRSWWFECNKDQDCCKETYQFSQYRIIVFFLKSHSRVSNTNFQGLSSIALLTQRKPDVKWTYLVQSSTFL